MAELDTIIAQSAETAAKLSKAEKQTQTERLLQLAEVYNIPGISPEPSRKGITGDIPDNFAVVSSVGAGILALELGGVEVYLNGAEPFVMPYLDATGQIQVRSPEYYRWVAHTVRGAANEWEGIDSDTHAQLEAMTGQTLPADYNTVHHGISQCVQGQLIRVDHDQVAYKANHPRHTANLFRFQESAQFYFEGDRFVESIYLSNPNSFPLPTSLLRHPYLSVPGGLRGSNVYVADLQGRHKHNLYDLGEYNKHGESRFEPLPLLTNEEVVIFERGDGHVFEIGFSGDYEPHHAGLQVFSNGTDPKQLQSDFVAKYALHARRVEAAVDIYRALGLDQAADSIVFDASEQQLMQQLLHNTAAICIEDNTSVGNIYTDGLQSAVIVEPGRSKHFVRTTRKLA